MYVVPSEYLLGTGRTFQSCMFGQCVRARQGVQNIAGLNVVPIRVDLSCACTYVCVWSVELGRKLAVLRQEEK